MRKFALLLTCILLIGVHVVFAQSRSITGTVTDSDSGVTMPGVSVSEAHVMHSTQFQQNPHQMQVC